MPVDPALVELIERTAAETRRQLEAGFGALRAELRAETSVLATRGELAEMAGSLGGEMSEMASTLRGEMSEMAGSLGGEMGEMASALRGEMGEMASALRGETAGMASTLRGGMKSLREELRGEIQESRRHADVIAEGLRGDIRLVAEGVVMANERIDALSGETKEGLADVRAMIRVSYRDLDHRVTRLESGAG